MKPIDSSTIAKPAVAAEPTATPKPEVLKAAREFEAIFLRSLLSSLEKTTKTSGGGSLSAGQSAYGGMVVSAMADAMTSAGGIGLAEIIAKAMTVEANAPPTDKGTQ
jgi:peptidoglycan hydrolase FlgJ